MTAIRGPYVFLSDDYDVMKQYEPSDLTTDKRIHSSRLGGCKSVALFGRQTPPAQAARWKAAGFQIIVWDVCHDGAEALDTNLRQLQADIFMPQAETYAEMDSLKRVLSADLHKRWVTEPVMTSGGMEGRTVAETDNNKRAMRNFGLQTVWVETYLQDVNANNPNLGDVNHMAWHFTHNYAWPEAHPVVGLWNRVSVTRYDLSKHGRNFGAWRSQQMEDWQYEEMGKVPDIAPPSAPDATAIRKRVVELAKPWDAANPGSRLARIHVARRIADAGSTDARWNDVRGDIVAMLDRVGYPSAIKSPPKAETSVRSDIAQAVRPWVVEYPNAKLARLSVIARITGVGSNDTRWMAVRTDVATALDKAGVPA